MVVPYACHTWVMCGHTGGGISPAHVQVNLCWAWPAGAGARQAGGGPRVPGGVARLGVGLSWVYTQYIPGIPKYRYITEQPAPIYPLPRGVRENLEAAWLAVEQYQDFIATLDQQEN